MNNVDLKIVPWEIGIQKPRGNILAELLRITISMSVDDRHVPQWRNQMNDETNRSFSLLVIGIVDYLCTPLLYTKKEGCEPLCDTTQTVLVTGHKSLTNVTGRQHLQRRTIHNDHFLNLTIRKCFLHDLIALIFKILGSNR